MAINIGKWFKEVSKYLRETVVYKTSGNWTVGGIGKAIFKSMLGDVATPMTRKSMHKGVFAAKIGLHAAAGFVGGAVMGATYGYNPIAAGFMGAAAGAGLRGIGYKGLTRPFIFGMGMGAVGMYHTYRTGEFDYSKAPNLRWTEIHQGFRRGMRAGITSWAISMIPGPKDVSMIKPVVGSSGVAGGGGATSTIAIRNWWKWPLVAGAGYAGLTNIGYYEKPLTDTMGGALALGGTVFAAGTFGPAYGPMAWRAASPKLAAAGQKISQAAQAVSGWLNKYGGHRFKPVKEAASVIEKKSSKVKSFYESMKKKIAETTFQDVAASGIEGVGTIFSARNLIGAAFLTTAAVGAYNMPMVGGLYAPIGTAGGMAAGGILGRSKTGMVLGAIAGSVLGMAITSGLGEEARVPAIRQGVIDSIYEMPMVGGSTLGSIGINVGRTMMGPFTSQNAVKGRGMPHDYMGATGDLVFALRTMRNKPNPMTYPQMQGGGM